ncbi:MAG: hypothetical protein PHW96_04880 [Candidatus Nanoarchaeia archaeon]|nr:hypothetical protein [Candidatus Nanoarchaeia archaeon]
MKLAVKLWDTYYKHYKRFLLLPMILLTVFSSVLIYNWALTGELLRKDFSLKGGVTATFYTEKQVDMYEFERYLEAETGYDVGVRDIRDVITNEVKGFSIVGDVNLDIENLKTLIENWIEEPLGEDNYSSGKQSSTLGEKFFSDAIVIFLIAFVLMSIIVFFSFKNLVSASTIILSTLTDIVCVLGLMNLLGMDVSIATLGGILMIVGYSTDSDIYMSTYMWKRKENELTDRMKHVFRTQSMMFITAFVAFTVMFWFSSVDMIKHIAFVLLLGLIFDFINTWFGTSALQRIYLERKKK